MKPTLKTIGAVWLIVLSTKGVYLILRWLCLHLEFSLSYLPSHYPNLILSTVTMNWFLDNENCLFWKSESPRGLVQVQQSVMKPIYVQLLTEYRLSKTKAWFFAIRDLHVWFLMQLKILLTLLYAFSQVWVVLWQCGFPYHWEQESIIHQVNQMNSLSLSRSKDGLPPNELLALSLQQPLPRPT